MQKVKELQNNGVNIDEKVSEKESFWGKVCTNLGIPNNKNNRYRLLKLHLFHKVCAYFYSISQFILLNIIHVILHI